MFFTVASPKSAVCCLMNSCFSHSFFCFSKKNEPKKGAFYDVFFNAAKALLKTMSKTARRS